MRTAERIRELTEELETNIKNIYVIANKVTDTNREKIANLARELDLKLIGTVPVDRMIEERDLAGDPLFDLPEDSIAVQEVERIAKELGL